MEDMFRSGYINEETLVYCGDYGYAERGWMRAGDVGLAGRFFAREEPNFRWPSNVSTPQFSGDPMKEDKPHRGFPRYAIASAVIVMAVVLATSVGFTAYQSNQAEVRLFAEEQRIAAERLQRMEDEKRAEDARLLAERERKAEQDEYERQIQALTKEVEEQKKESEEQKQIVNQLLLEKNLREEQERKNEEIRKQNNITNSAPKPSNIIMNIMPPAPKREVREVRVINAPVYTAPAVYTTPVISTPIYAPVYRYSHNYVYRPPARRPHFSAGLRIPLGKKGSLNFRLFQ
jgi:hypothetical protein